MSCGKYVILLVLRWLNYILPLYILVLAILPCTDQIEAQTPTELIHLKSDSHDHEEGDTCTPLCSCSCCGAHITEVSNFWYESPEQPLVYQIKDLFFKKKSILSDYKGSVWQPPQFQV